MPVNARSLAGGILVACAGAMPLLGVLAPRGLAVLGIVAMLGVLPLAWSERSWRVLPRTVVVLSLAVGIFGMVSALWAIDVQQALAGAFKQTVTTAGGLVLVSAIGHVDESARRRMAWVLLVAVAVAGVLLAIENFTDRGFSRWMLGLRDMQVIGNKSRLSRGATVLTLSVMILPALFRDSRQRWPLLVAVLALPVLWAGDSLSTRLSVSMGLGAALVVGLWPRVGIRVLMAAMVVLWLGAPIVAARLPDPHTTFQNWTWLPMSSHHRVTIWEFTGRHIVQKPVFGWGMEAARVMPGGDDEIRVNRHDADGRVVASLLEAQLPLHPHNAVLQVWLELGAVGALLSLGFLIAVLRGIDTLPLSDRSGRAAAAACLVAGMTISAVSYGAWQSWWQTTLWAVSACLLAGLAPARQAKGA